MQIASDFNWSNRSNFTSDQTYKYNKEEVRKEWMLMMQSGFVPDSGFLHPVVSVWKGLNRLKTVL